MESTLNTRHIKTLTGDTPVYLQYPRQSSCQSAHICLNIKTALVYAEADTAIGGCSSDVWHGIVRRYEINPLLTAEEIQQIVLDILPLLDRVYDGSDVVWNGNNHVAQLDDNAKTAEDEIESAIGIDQ